MDYSTALGDGSYLAIDYQYVLSFRYTFYAIVFLLISTIYVYEPKKKQKYADVPIVGVNGLDELPQARERFRTGAQDILLEGYGKFKGQPFYVPSPLGERLMVPPRYVEELKNQRVDEVDFVGTFFEMFEGRYTTFGSRASLHPRVAKVQLNQNMSSVLEPLFDEIKAAFDDLLPISEEWTPVNMSDKMLMIVARASSRMFGGLALSRNEAWLKTTLNFASDGFIGAQKIKQYPPFLRPLVSYFIPELWSIRRHYQIARKAIVPILKSRGVQNPKEKPSDFLQWMADDAKEEESNPEFIADLQLKMSFAALHTSAATPMQLIYDLCSMPEYVAPLIEEIESVLGSNGPIEKQTLMQLTKLDSFMKESQRFNPLLLVTFERIIHKDFRFSDGFTIPAGTQVSVPAQAIAMDPDLFKDPKVFDGFRFSDLESTSGEIESKVRPQWAASNLTNMAFGYGRHACPGRAFAGFEIKQIMVHLLKNYEFKFGEDVKSRPENIKIETQMIPNHTTQILLRRRKE